MDGGGGAVPVADYRTTPCWHTPFLAFLGSPGGEDFGTAVLGRTCATMPGATWPRSCRTASRSNSGAAPVLGVDGEDGDLGLRT